MASYHCFSKKKISIISLFWNLKFKFVKFKFVETWVSKIRILKKNVIRKF